MRPILFSVSYAGLWGQQALTLEQFIPHARQIGYAGVELMAKRPHLSALDWQPQTALRLRDLCRRHGVGVACIAGYTNFTGGADSAEVPFVEMQVLYTEALVALAQALDCRLVRVFTAYERTDLPLAQQWSRTVAAIRECGDRAAAAGVTIGIQNHHDIAVHSRALVELLHDIDRPNVKLMLDPWTLCLRGEELYATARDLAPHVVHTTLADYVRLPRYRYEPDLVNYRAVAEDWVRAVPMGTGVMDNLTFLRGLRDGGYDGTVAYEMCSPLRGGGGIENLDRCARGCLDWLCANGFIERTSSVVH